MYLLKFLKKIVLSSCLFVLTFSFLASHSVFAQVYIEGKIFSRSVDLDGLYVHRVSNELKFPRSIIDSVETKQNGSFSFKVNPPNLYLLEIGTNTFKKIEIPIFIDITDTISISIELFKQGQGYERASVQYLKAPIKTIEFNTIHSENEKIYNDYFEYSSKQREKVKQDYEIIYNWEKEFRKFRKRINRERDPFVKQALIISYLKFDFIDNWSTRNSYNFDKEFGKEVLETIPPESPLWSYFSVGLYRVLFRASEGDKQYSDLEGEFIDLKEEGDLYSKYVDKYVESQPDSTITLSRLETALDWAFEFKQFEQFQKYYQRIMKDYGDSRVAERVRKKFDPQKKVKPNSQIPPFDFKVFGSSSKKVTNETMIGKTYLINFWATWCGPCMTKLDELEKVYTFYLSKEFEVINVSINFNKSEINKVRKSKAIPSINTHLENWSNPYNEVMKAFEVIGIPKTILVNKTGKIVLVDPSREEIVSYLRLNLE